MKSADVKSDAWEYLAEIDPDVAFLQEVKELPASISINYQVKRGEARTKHGGFQKFSTYVLSKKPFVGELTLNTKYTWANEQLKKFLEI